MPQREDEAETCPIGLLALTRPRSGFTGHTMLPQKPRSGSTLGGDVFLIHLAQPLSKVFGGFQRAFTSRT